MAATPTRTVGTFTTPTRWPMGTRPTYTTAMPATSSSSAMARPEIQRVPSAMSTSGSMISGSTAATRSYSETTTADPRIEIGVQQVDEQVDGHVDDGDDEDGALDDGVVVVAGGVDDGLAHAGKREHLLDDDGPP